MRRDVAILFAVLALGLPAGAAAQDTKKGETVFKRTCAACHTVEAGKNKVGPSLAGIVGRKAGTVDGFKYSDPMKNSGLTWTEENLDKYLADPKGFIPGNRMAFAGVKKEDERHAVIEYLEHLKTAGAS